MTDAGGCAGTVIVLDSDSEDEEKSACAQCVVHKARKTITERADACQRVLVQLTKDYTVSPFFEPRKKNRCQTSAVSPVVIDDDEDKDDTTKEVSQVQRIPLSGHTRQLSEDEKSGLQKLLDLWRKVPLCLKEPEDLEATWKTVTTEADEAINRTPTIWDNTTSIETVSNVEQSDETVDALSCDDVSNALASVRTDIDEITIRRIVDEVFNEHERHREDYQQMLWSEKYRPHNSRFLCITHQTKEQFGTWLSDWADIVTQKKAELAPDDKGVPIKEKKCRSTSRLCIVYGHGSCGKTAMVYACAEERGMEVMEMNASECRSGPTVLKRIAESVGTQRIGTEQTNTKGKSRRRLILFDDADVALSEDKGFYSAVAKLAESSEYPIVLTCRHRTQKIMKLSQDVLFIHVSIPSFPDIALFATAITIAELFSLSTEASKSMDESVHARDVVSSIYKCFSTVSQMIPTQVGLKGLLFWAQMNMRDTKSLQKHLNNHTVSRSVIGVSNNAASQDSLEADLETCHLQGIDCGFDSWPSWNSIACEYQFTR